MNIFGSVEFTESLYELFSVCILFSHKKKTAQELSAQILAHETVIDNL